MKKLVSIIQSKHIYIILSVILTLILYLFDYKISGIGSINKFMFFMAIIIIVIVMLYIIIEKLEKTHIIFLIISLMLGSLYTLSSPLFTGSDEHNHYYRIYEITDFQLITPINNGYVGSQLPSSLRKTFELNNEILVNRNTYIKYSDISDMMKIKLDRDVKEQYGKGYTTEYSNTALYSPIQYLPQIIGMSIGKILGFGPYILGMIARFCNIIVYSLICTFAIKKIPKHKIFLSVLLLCPNILANVATLSADAFTLSLVALFIASILELIYKKDKLCNKKDKILLLALVILLVNCKIVYLPLIFLLLLIPKEKVEKRNKFIIISIILGIIFGFGWLMITDRYFDVYYVSSDAQKKFIFGHLIEYIAIVCRTYFLNFTKLMENMVIGSEMFHAQISVYSFFSIGYICVLILSLLNEKVKEKINISNKILISFIALAMVALITTAIYVQCTANFISVGNSVIVGIQGRYFLPIMVLFPLFISPNKKFMDDKLLVQISLCMSIPVLLTICMRFLNF